MTNKKRGCFIKIGIIGSRSIKNVALEKYLPDKIDAIISGGAQGVDLCAKEFAIKNKIHFLEFLPQYNIYKKGAPIRRNHQIIDACDVVYAFWDGKSPGTKSTIDYCKKKDKEIKIFLFAD